ncbi:MAG: hypothetical protein LBE36_04475 [Flavobacteriaceae bacterium]|jgi:ABC-type Na+ efflux pump permease subunit|nr:hypothetical protein [Flavobacteriaceae bacterium]
MKKLTLTCLAIFSANLLLSQTKIIAYKSHSGNMANFEKAVFENKFDSNFSNLGNPPFETKIDSVIVVNDEKVVVISKSGWGYDRIKLNDRNVKTFPIKTDENQNKNPDDNTLEFSTKENEYGLFYSVSYRDSSTVFLKYDEKNHTYKNLKNVKISPNYKDGSTKFKAVESSKTKTSKIKTSKIKQASLVSNLLILFVFSISILNAFISRKK